MANMTFKASLLPNSNLGYNLGSSTQQWNVYGTLTGNASTATKLVTARSLKTKLDSTTAVTFDGSAAQDAIPVTGTLPIANGGTGATTAANARANLAVPYMVTESYPALLPTNASNNWIKIGTANTSYGLLPSQAGSAGSGHNYLGTSSWYWKYAYIDQIYGYLNGNISGNAATATKLSNTPSNTTTFLRGDNTWSDTIVGAAPYFTIKTNNNSNYAVLRFATNNSSEAAVLFLNAPSRSGDGDANTLTLRNNVGNIRINSNTVATGRLTVGQATVNTSYMFYVNGNTYHTGGGIQLPTTASSALPNNWISCGGGYSSGTGKSGLKLLVCEQSDCESGLGQDLGGGPYELSFITGQNPGDATNAFFRWLRHNKASPTSYTKLMQLDGSGALTSAKVYGAVWNDYAEFRETKEKIEPGRCIREIGDDTLVLTTKRLEKGCEIVSDTYGFAIGESDRCKTPTACTGRVLAYPYETINEFKKHIGDCVCSGPNGTVSIMTEEEERLYPGRIIGTISAIPDYEIWLANSNEIPQEIKVNGRVWIRIR